NEILFNSGLSERTYTVIGQGLVDAALSLKADERRKLFEEAAGIGLYRARKEQAMRRLDNTKRNLERVEDILAELNPRLRSLDRQAKRAREYEQIKTDLQEVLREWYGYHWHRAQGELKDAREAAQIHEASLDQARQVQGSYSDELNATRDKINSLRARLSSWHRRLAELHTERETTSRDLAVGDERQRALREERDRLITQKTGLEEEIAGLKARLSEINEEVERLQSEAREAEVQAAEVRKSFDGRISERQKIEEATQARRDEIAGFRAREIELEARKAELESRVERFQVRKESVASALGEAEKAYQAVEGKFKEAHSNRQKAEKNLLKVEEALKTEQSNLAQLEEERKNGLAEQAEYKAKMAGLQAQLDVLDQAERALTGYASGARLLLEAARNKSLDGSRGALSNYLEVPPEMEVAVAAALGDFVDAVLLESEGDSEKAMELLAGESSRATLLPMKSLMPLAPLKAPKMDGCLGVASSLVSVPPDMRPVVDLLLGQVLIVKGRKDARAALAGQDGQARAVTLHGEVFHASGAILVDSEGGAGTISRPRERRELSDELEATGKLVEQISSKLSGLTENVEKQQLAIKELEGNIEKARGEQESAKAALNEIELATEHARRQLEWEKSQQLGLEDELNDAIEGVTSMAKEKAELAGKIEEGAEELKAQTMALANLSVDDLQEQLNHWTTLVAVSRRAVEDGQVRQAERQQAVDKSLAQFRTVKERLDGLELQIQAIKDEIGSWRDSEGTVGGEIGALQVLIDPAEEELRTADSEQEELQAKEAEARQALNVAERNHTQAQIGLARKQEALDRLRQRVEDDFGLVEFEYDETISGPTPLPFGDLVEKLPVVTELSAEIEEILKRQRAQLRRMGSINPEAQQEYQEVSERQTFLVSQVADLTSAEKDIREVITELESLMEREFRKTFDVVASEFREIFTRLFGGGSARLLLTDETDLTQTGIDIEARLPGKRAQRLALLSGGERSLTAAALVFSLLKASPTPFCVMDEVDAMLDEANVGRFRDVLADLSKQTQFVVITHNRNTVQAADVIYGITMGRDTSSQIISLKLDEVDERYSS
ncbi:MAG: chromosome segregation protein SMC, partial [Anaerolineae bacterium]|nr:chromosome segregation protein SMC [Anaerolineae bacterium]